VLYGFLSFVQHRCPTSASTTRALHARLAKRDALCSRVTRGVGRERNPMKSLYCVLPTLLVVMVFTGCAATPKPKRQASIFTLECTGTRETKDPVTNESISKVYTFELDATPARYFDWTAKRWIPLKSQTDQLLVLKFDMKTGAMLEDIDRTSGRWSDLFAVPNLPEYSVRGVCSKIEHESPPSTTPRMF
jgi:hypothetical protein